MNAQQKGLITLLRSAITGEALALPEEFSLEEAMDLIRRHALATLVYEGAVQCGIGRQKPVMQKLFQAYLKIMLRSEGQVRDTQRIFDAFEANGIDYMPLKGCKMKALYPRPELRVMGDADILIRMEQYDRVAPVMESMGFVFDDESDHELHWKSAALHVELHKRVIPSYNKDFYAYFGEGWLRAVPESGCRYTMTAEDEMVYLFTHFAKHYRDGGIGCRHVVDLWVYRMHHPELDEGVILRELEQLNLVEFYENMLRLIRVWFEDEQPDAQIDFMTEFIFASGSWGHMESRTLSIAVRDLHRRNAAGGRLAYALRIAFPGVLELRKKYTVLQKAPWLLPAVWVYRPFYKLLFERNTLGRHREAMEVLTADNVDEQHRLLNYVGLDYNF